MVIKSTLGLNASAKKNSLLQKSGAYSRVKVGKTFLLVTFFSILVRRVINILDNFSIKLHYLGQKDIKKNKKETAFSCGFMVKPINLFKVNTLTMVIILIIGILLSGCTLWSNSSPSDPQKLRSTSANFYRVQTGDTLYSIARRHDIDIEKLAEINGIKPPYRIFKGQVIKLSNDEKNKSVTTQSPQKTPPKSTQNPQGVQDKNSASARVNRSKNQSVASNSVPKKTFEESTLKWQWPVPGRVIALFQGGNGANKGIDIGGKLGEPVLAAASGQVVYSGEGLRGYGKLLIIRHNDIYLSAYAHNNRLLVKEGDFVKVGQRIADMGSSGTDGIKLHFEIRSEGNPVDPLKFLPKR